MRKVAIIACVSMIQSFTVIVGLAGSPDSTIVKSIMGMANSVTEFPRTRDTESVLQFYTRDFTEISDGAVETVDNIELMLSQIKEQLDLGLQIGISMKVEDVYAHSIDSTTGWGTYGYVVKIGSAGKILSEETGKCTFITKRVGSDWLIHHQHCSSPQQVPAK